MKLQYQQQQRKYHQSSSSSNKVNYKNNNYNNNNNSSINNNINNNQSLCRKLTSTLSSSTSLPSFQHDSNTTAWQLTAPSSPRLYSTYRPIAVSFFFCIFAANASLYALFAIIDCCCCFCWQHFYYYSCRCCKALQGTPLLHNQNVLLTANVCRADYVAFHTK